MTDIRTTARALWRESRDRVVAQSDSALAAARSWSRTGSDSDLAPVRSLAHQLTGSLGTYAAALRSGGPGDAAAEEAAQSAARLDAAAHQANPDPVEVLAAAQDLRIALAAMVD